MSFEGGFLGDDSERAVKVVCDRRGEAAPSTRKPSGVIEGSLSAALPAESVDLPGSSWTGVSSPLGREICRPSIAGAD